MKPTPPCGGCAKRCFGCHSKCKDYLAYRAELDKYNEERQKLRKQDSDFYQGINKRRKKKR